MKTTVNFTQFIDALNAHDRLRTDGKNGNFNCDGARILFNFLEQFEKETGEELELDIVNICCNYSQDSFLDVARDYDIDITDCEDDLRGRVMDYLSEHTSVCGQNDETIVYQQF